MLPLRAVSIAKQQGELGSLTMDITVSRTDDGSRATPSKIASLPRLDVMITIVCLKETVRPWLSVTRPSSKICSHDQHEFY